MYLSINIVDRGINNEGMAKHGSGLLLFDYKILR